MGMPGDARAMAFIVTRDRAAAKAFYGGRLGLAVSHEDEFAVVFDLNGTALRVSQVAGHVPQPHTVLGWEVADIAAAVRSLREAGIAFRTFDGLGQDALGIWTAPGGTARVAWFEYPDGNLLSLMQPGASARSAGSPG